MQERTIAALTEQLNKAKRQAAGLRVQVAQFEAAESEAFRSPRPESLADAPSSSSMAMDLMSPRLEAFLEEGSSRPAKAAETNQRLQQQQQLGFAKRVAPKKRGLSVAELEAWSSDEDADSFDLPPASPRTLGNVFGDIRQIQAEDDTFTGKSEGVARRDMMSPRLEKFLEEPSGAAGRGALRGPAKARGTPLGSAASVPAKPAAAVKSASALQRASSSSSSSTDAGDSAREEAAAALQTAMKQRDEARDDTATALDAVSQWEQRYAGLREELALALSQRDQVRVLLNRLALLLFPIFC